MDENLLTLMRKLPLNKETVTAVLPLLSRYGVAGALVLARGYLGPLARQAGACNQQPPPPTEPPDGTSNEPNGTTPGTSIEAPAAAAATAVTTAPSDAAVLGLALTKLIFELGEIALHNPTLDPTGKQPEFKLDDKGCPPAMSVTHVLAAARLWRQYSARRDAERQAEEAATVTVLDRSPRAQLQAARSERYAATPRYSYLAPVATYRGPR